MLRLTRYRTYDSRALFAHFLFAVLLWTGMHCAIAAATTDWRTLTIDHSHESYTPTALLQYLEDPTRELDITQVASTESMARFQPVPFDREEINFGYSHSVYWLALPINIGSSAPTDWLLEIGYPSLDKVEVYAPQPQGNYEMQTAGDMQPFNLRPFQHRNLVFPLHLMHNATQVIYIRVESEGNLTIPVKLWQPEALHMHDQTTYSVLSIYYGMLLALLLYNLLLYFSTLDKVFLAYVAFVTSMAVGQASMNGFGNQFIWPNWPAFGNIALPSGMAATGLFGALFTRQFFDTVHNFPWLDRLLLVLAVVFLAGVLAPAVASYQFAAIFVSAGGLTASIFFTSAGVYCMKKGHPGARYYLLSWLLLMVGVGVLALRNMAWLPTNNLTLNGMQIGSALEMLLLSFALADRLNVMRRAKDQATHEAMIAKQAMLDALRLNELELETRVTDRTRDLERANSRLREKERQLEHLARHDPLTGLANRALLDERMLQVLARARRNESNVAVLLSDLDGFKKVNDEYGHAVGDRLLMAVAQRLSKNVRASDTVARFGGDEFVVIMEDLHDLAESERVAQKLVDEIGLPYELDVGVIHISVSIGIAHYPANGGDSAQLIKRADQAMYSAKAAGRNQWRIVQDD